MNVLAIDPGIRVAGAALFVEGRLFGADVIYMRERGARPWECARMAHSFLVWLNSVVPYHNMVDVLVMEWPQVYTQSKWKGDPNDLLPLAGVDAAICATIPSVQHVAYLPREWKGNMPKEVHQPRALAKLEREEKVVVQGATARGGTEAHNMVDAVAIGLFYLGRMIPHRVIPR